MAQPAMQAEVMLGIANLPADGHECSVMLSMPAGLLSPYTCGRRNYSYHSSQCSGEEHAHIKHMYIPEKYLDMKLFIYIQ